MFLNATESPIHHPLIRTTSSFWVIILGRICVLPTSHRHRHSNSGLPFFLIWSLPRLWYGFLSGSMSLNHLFIFYNISCYNFLVLLTFVSRSSCRIYLYIHKGMKQSSKYKEGILASTRYFTITCQF